jgi:hypothetical protein
MSDQIIDKKKSDLTNLLRVTDNTTKLLTEGVFPGGACLALAESLNWMQAIKKDIETQLSALSGVAGVVKVPEVVS